MTRSYRYPTPVPPQHFPAECRRPPSPLDQNLVEMPNRIVHTAGFWRWRLAGWQPAQASASTDVMKRAKICHSRWRVVNRFLCLGSQGKVRPIQVILKCRGVFLSPMDGVDPMKPGNGMGSEVGRSQVDPQCNVCRGCILHGAGVLRRFQVSNWGYLSRTCTCF
jgi:hypothetical protein